MIWFVLFVGAWVACGVVAGMNTFATFQGKFPEIADSEVRNDRAFAWTAFVLGPIGLVFGCVLGEFCSGGAPFKYGFRRFW